MSEQERTRLVVYLPKWVAEKLTAQAEKRGLTASVLARYAILSWLDRGDRLDDLDARLDLAEHTLDELRGISDDMKALRGEDEHA